MTTTFAKPPEGLADTRPGPFGGSDLRFSPQPTVIPPGLGEAPDSAAAPFARLVAKDSWDISGTGAVVVASTPTDTATQSGGRTDDGPVDDP